MTCWKRTFYIMRHGFICMICEQTDNQHTEIPTSLRMKKARMSKSKARQCWLFSFITYHSRMAPLGHIVNQHVLAKLREEEVQAVEECPIIKLFLANKMFIVLDYSGYYSFCSALITVLFPKVKFALRKLFFRL